MEQREQSQALNSAESRQKSAKLKLIILRSLPMMKNVYKMMAAATVSILLTGCGLYKEAKALHGEYESQAKITANAYGTSDDLKEYPTNGSLADISWRDFFTDPLLQKLIDQVLANNTDLNSACIAVEKSIDRKSVV